MDFRDFSKSRSKIKAQVTDAVFTELLKHSINRIHALQHFYYTGIQVREKETIKCPACILIPRMVDVVEQHLAGGRFDMRYTVDMAFVIRHSNDCIAMQQALYFSEQVRKSFAVGDNNVKILEFEIVGGVHYNTVVSAAPIEVIEVVGNNVLAFSSGVQVVFSVWVNY